MDEQTTTAATPVEDTGVEETLPVEQDEQAAATEPAEPISTEAEGDEDSSVPEADDKLKAWAESKGIPLDSAGAIKAAKIAMDNQAEFQRTRQKTSELEKTLRAELTDAANDGDANLVAQLAEEVQNLKLAQTVNEFFEASDMPADKRAAAAADRRELEPAMAKIVTEDPNIGRLVKAGYISYEQLAAMARGSDSGRDEKLKTDGGREALQKVADKTSAKAVAGSATTSDMSSEKKTDPFLSGFDRNSS